nr:MAG: hypothetical protein [Microvirus sp.]
MGYPLSYRNGARKYQAGGFQKPATIPPGPKRDPMHPPYTPPPKPANDPYPRPDNDNVPGRGRYEHPPFPKLPAWPGDPVAVAAAAGEIFLPPPVRKAVDTGRMVFQVYEWFKHPTAMPEIDTGGWWRVVCGPVVSPNTGPYRWYPSKSNLCGLGGQAGNTLAEPWTRWFEQGWMLVKHDSIAYGNPVGRWQVVQVWERVGYDTGAYAKGPVQKFPLAPYMPAMIPAPLPATVTNPLPAIVPAPVGNQVPDMKPIPARVPAARPGRSPYWRPSSVSRPGKAPEPGKITGPVVVINPPTVTNPVRKPPGPGVKERKIRASGSLAFMNGALSAASGIYEDAKFANDIINAFYNALPGKHGEKTPQGKLAAIYRDYDKIDVNKAIFGVLIAVAGEKAGAYIDRARGMAAENLGLSLNVTIPTGSAPRI